MSEIKPLNYAALGVEAPTVDIHQEPQLIKAKGPWKQQGNHIYREGDEVRYASRIPPNYILKGTDEEGLPILQKIEL